MQIRIQLFISVRKPDPDPNPGHSLKSQKVKFYMKNILKFKQVINIRIGIGQKDTQELTEVQKKPF
jgi:hypothetical protein